MSAIFSENGISVIICCYNSAERLPNTLKHLSEQSLDKSLSFEVIVVDNASKDNTVEVARNEWQKYQIHGINLTIVSEKKPGLIHARHKGVSEAKFGLLIFCDDDNWLQHDYLQIAYNSYSSPEIGAIGGFGIVASEGKLPPWFENSKGAYAVGPQFIHESNTNIVNHLWGAGLVIPKSLYNKAYSKHSSLLTGRVGNQLSSGEDSELTMRLQLMGYTLKYINELVYHHYIPANRLTDEYLTKLYKDGAESSTMVINYYTKQILINRLKTISKVKLTIATLCRAIMCKLKISQLWNLEYESMVLFMLTGLKLTKISSELVIIKDIK